MDLTVPQAFALASGKMLAAFGLAALAMIATPPSEGGAVTGLQYVDGRVIFACQFATYAMAANGAFTQVGAA